MSEWICPICQHEVMADERPQPITWTDSHICRFSRKTTARQLPIVHLGLVEYFWDERLNEYRNINDPHDVVKWDVGRRKRMEDVAKEMADWFKGTDDALFQDEDGHIDKSITYTGEELGSMAGDHLSGEVGGFYFYELTAAERIEVKKMAFDEEIYVC